MTSPLTAIRQRYKRRNLADGKCANCRQERAATSTRFCPAHLLKNRESQRAHREKKKAVR